MVLENGLNTKTLLKAKFIKIVNSKLNCYNANIIKEMYATLYTYSA